MYDMQILGDATMSSTNSMPPNITTDLNDNTRSYENISPSASNPSSPTSESAQLLPNSNSGTGGSSSSKLGVPVFNALHNKQRGTRSRITFLPRTPSPQPDRKMLPGMSEEYEPISPRTSTGDETLPIDIKSKSIDSGYENATLGSDGKLKTKLRNSGGSGYENAMVNHENNSEIYDYASPIVSPTISHSAVDNEYATPEVNKVDYNKLKPINRHLDIPNSSGNQYNKLNCSAGTIIAQAEEGGEYSQLRREGEDLSKTKQGIKTLPDVIKGIQKH